MDEKEGRKFEEKTSSLVDYTSTAATVCPRRCYLSVLPSPHSGVDAVMVEATEGVEEGARALVWRDLAKRRRRQTRAHKAALVTTNAVAAAPANATKMAARASMRWS